jgi:hypothetical protein
MGDGFPRSLSLKERRSRFDRGLEDGALGTEVEHPWSSDYMEGWLEGRKKRKALRGSKHDR